MSFGTALRRKFNKLCATKGAYARETDLFQRLVEAFVELGKNKSWKIAQIHGKRWCVKFDDTDTSTSKKFYWGAGGDTTCELGDLLFLVIDEENNMARISVMQNKYDRKKHFNYSFLAQMNQLYLLKERPVFTYETNKKNMLKEAKIPSIGNYGVFRKNKFENSFEMAYYSADCLERTKCSKPKSKRVVKLREEKRRNKIGDYEQQNFCRNLTEFGDALIGMRIGEPMSIYESMVALNNIDVLEELRQNWNIYVDYPIDKDRLANHQANKKWYSITAREIILLRGHREPMAKIIEDDK